VNARISLFASLLLLLPACGGAPATVADKAPVAETASEKTADVKAAPVAPTAKTFDSQDIPFAPFNPKQPKGIHVFPLTGNPQSSAFSAVVRFPAGFETPLHTHKFSYSAVALSDGLFHGLSTESKHDVTKGSQWTQPGGEAHLDGCKAETYCYFFIVFEGPVDLTPAETPVEKSTGSATAYADIQWKELKGGVKMAVVSGNPKVGPFTGLFSFPKGMTTNVHTHSSDFSGALLSGIHHRGPSADALKTLSPGSAWAEPAGSAHMEKCGDQEDCVIVGTFNGPLDTKNVELSTEKTAPAAAEPSK
jgi:quercetin dioxygenase-like cupin family protein